MLATEEQEHLAFVEWFSLQHASLKDLLIHYPSGGSRHLLEAKKLKKMGVKKGIPDFYLPLPNDKYVSLWIELKRLKNFKISKEQQWWVDKLNALGHMACFAFGWQHAAKIAQEYLK